MPVRTTPQAATQKWVTNLSGASDRMKAGAMGVTVSPGVAAAANADKWLARVTAAKAKYIAGSQRYTLAQWQSAYVNVGIPRVAQGAQAKQGKVQDFLTQFLPYLAQGAAQIDQMPTTTLEQSIAKASAQMRYNAAFVRKPSGS
jgi:hypothetical protein